MSDSKQQLVLIDGSGYLHRAYHALPELHNKKGFPTHVILGTVNMLQRLLDEYTSSCVAVIFDPPGKNFRHEIDENYKANRPPTPEDLKCQFAPVTQLIKAMGVPVFQVPGYEADDVIASLTQQGKNAGFEVCIVSSDKDLMQLVDDNVFLLDPVRFTRRRATEIYEKFGVQPSQMGDFLALQGDQSDNIPGVSGVGAKTAAKWLEQYKDLDGIVQNADGIKGKVGEKLRAGFEQLQRSRQLVALKLDVACNVKDCRMQQVDEETLIALCKEYDLKNLLQKFQRAAPEKIHYVPVESNDHWQKILQKTDHTACVCCWLDIGADNAIHGIALSMEMFEVFYLDVLKIYDEFVDYLLPLKDVLEDSSIKKYGYHWKRMYHVFDQYSIQVSGVQGDVLLASYVHQVGAPHGRLVDLASHYLSLHLEESSDSQDWSNQCSFCDAVFRLTHFLHHALKEQPPLWSIYADLELPLAFVLFDMERQGVCLDEASIMAYQKQAQREINGLLEKMKERCGQSINFNSTTQVQTLLFETLKLPVVKKTPKGQPSTDESVLQVLEKKHPIAQLLLRYRNVTKIKSTYLDALPKHVRLSTKRIHTTYQQTVAVTGRLSSVEPNLQNIPIRGEWGTRLRCAFVAPEKACLVGADYSQIELRVMAHLSQDSQLINAFLQQQDIHRITASEIFEQSVETITPEQRYKAKAINFGIVYGISPFGLARQINVEQSVAKRYIESYFLRYKDVKIYMDEMRKKGEKDGYVQTILGRRIYLQGIKTGSHAQRQHAQRLAINAPVQGSAADLIKVAMLNVQDYLAYQTDVRLVMQVHDELLLTCLLPSTVQLKNDLRVRMTQLSLKLDVPLVVNILEGLNWGNVH